MDSTFVLTEPILPMKPTKLVLPSAKDNKGSETGNSAPGLTLLRYYDVNKVWHIYFSVLHPSYPIAC